MAGRAGGVPVHLIAVGQQLTPSSPHKSWHSVPDHLGIVPDYVVVEVRPKNANRHQRANVTLKKQRPLSLPLSVLFIRPSLFLRACVRRRQRDSIQDRATHEQRSQSVRSQIQAFLHYFVEKMSLLFPVQPSYIGEFILGKDMPNSNPGSWVEP